MTRALAIALIATLAALPALAQSPQARPPGIADRLAEGMLAQARRANVPADQMPEWRRLAACTAGVLVRSNLSNAVLEQAARDAAAGRQNGDVERRTDLRDETMRRCMPG
ncbi:hypothetical protein [Roseomonas sp. HF4]|uniref:hypothetical protein n=1 Tax=Roseomonas sp. HF4 TaxID=2562313 RepID=UPI0010C12F08|nr:hypothetical protein [Roseomonas sp. HF4]